MEYYDGTGGSVALLQWSHPGQSLQTIPANRLLSPVGSTGLTSATAKQAKADVNEPVIASPNPATSNDLMAVQVFSDYKTGATLSLVSMNGQTQLNRKIVLQEGLNTIRFSMTELSSGIYILSINDGRKRTVKKIFVSH
jgi:hypothetical protein